MCVVVVFVVVVVVVVRLFVFLLFCVHTYDCTKIQPTRRVNHNRQSISVVDDALLGDLDDTVLAAGLGVRHVSRGTDPRAHGADANLTALPADGVPTDAVTSMYFPGGKRLWNDVVLKI
jgi:hypothetical protein